MEIDRLLELAQNTNDSDALKMILSNRIDVYAGDECGACIGGCPAEAMTRERTVEVRIGDHIFRHGDLKTGKCSPIHQGWDPRYSPFLKEDSSRENPPPYYRFLDRRFRHHSICVARGCVRACMDHLEKSGRIERQYKTPMIEGKQWVIEDPI